MKEAGSIFAVMRKMLLFAAVRRVRKACHRPGMTKIFAFCRVRRDRTDNFFTLADIKKFVKAVLDKDERPYSENVSAVAEAVHSPACAGESRGSGWLYVDEKYARAGELFPKGSFGHCGHTGQSIFFDREKGSCVAILTNATRFLSRRSGFRDYNYNVIYEMRRDIHHEILKDLSAQGLL